MSGTNDGKVIQQENPMKEVKNDEPPEMRDKDSERILFWRAKAELIFESNYFVGLMSILTIWALFNDDIRLAGTFKNADLGFDVVISITFFLFLFEIFASSFYKGQTYLYIPAWEPLPNENILQTWARRLMFGSFYFWLDWIATLTLIFEVIFSSFSKKKI